MPGRSVSVRECNEQPLQRWLSERQVRQVHVKGCCRGTQGEARGLTSTGRGPG